MYITALDFGSSQIKALVAEIKGDNKMSLVGVLKMPAAGLRKGEVSSLEDAVQSLNPLFNEIRKISKAALKNIFININGSNAKIQNSRGIAAVSRADNEIYQDDIDRVIKASQAINIGHNGIILHTITKEFIVDGIGDIRDPLGMIGNRLEVNSLIVEAFKPSVNSLIRVVEAAGGRIGGLIYGPLASAQSVSTKNQRELGIVVIDIGFSTTGMSVYEEDKLIYASVFPVGSSNITNDLAIGLRCSVEAAETIKISFGSALAKDVSLKDKLELHQIDESLDTVINKRFISEIIEVRLAEILELVNNELKLINKSGKLPGGAIVTGGTAKISNITNLIKQELKLSSQIGVPMVNDLEFTNAEFSSQIENSEFAVSTGLLIWGKSQVRKDKNWIIDKGGKMSKIFKYFIP